MKIALMADIHANLPALEKALDICQEEQVELHLVAGDILGYYPYPCEVLEILRYRLGPKVIMIAGNHDFKVATGEELPESFSATVMARWQREELSDDELDFIGNLPTKRFLNLEGQRLLLVHGSPNAPLEGRIESPSDVPKVEDVDIVVFGHTHRPMVTERGGVLWINPGAVGQPRDGDWRGGLGVLDLPKCKLKLLRFDYEVEEVVERWKEVSPGGLDDRLVQWLREGRYPT